LSEGYFLPPLLFTPTEAQALSLSARLFTTMTKGKLSQDAENALAKIALVLPKHLRDVVDMLTTTIGFIAPSSLVDLDDSRLSIIQAAIQEQHVVHLSYYSHSGNELTERDIEPYLLSYSERLLNN
jgi:predicted DNA-binding transcriptional regulator YafY